MPCARFTRLQPRNRKIREVVDNAQNGYLSPDEIHTLLDAAGVARAKEGVSDNEEEIVKMAKEIGFPLVMKVVGPIHKSDVGGVVLNVSDEETVRREFKRMMQIKDTYAIMLAQQLSGTQVFIGAKRDDKFGHMVLCGLGGIFIEVLKDVKAGLAPMSKEEAPVVYSIILTGYCEFLIDNKEYEKARSLVMEAIKSSKYTQLDEYNVKFLRILSELEEKEHFSIKGCLWIVTLLLLVFVFCKWRSAVKKQKEVIRGVGTEMEVETPLSDSDSNGENGESLSESGNGNDMLLKTMALTEIMPQFWKIVTRIKSMAGSKSDVLKGIKEIEDILGFLTPEKLGKDFAFYVEQEAQDFYNKLKKKHPDLSILDLRLCILIKLGLNTKEIANLTNKSVRGVESGKFRLKKKLDLDTSKDIYDYLLEIEQS